MRAKPIVPALVATLCVTAVAAAQSDPTVVTMHVERTSNYVQGVLINLHVHVNGRAVGSLADGKSSSFLVSAAKDGEYAIRVDDWTGLNADTCFVRARPGETIRCRTGVGFWGVFVDPPSVEPLHPLRLYVTSEEPRTLEIDGIRQRIETDGFVELPFRVPTSRVARLEATLDGRAWPVFTSPLHVAWVACDSDRACDEAFLTQLELARAHHFGTEGVRVRSAIDAYRDDFEAMLPPVMRASTRELVEVERLWIAAMWKASEEGVLQDALLNAGGAVAELAIVALFSGSAPTGADAAAKAIESAIGTGWDVWTRESGLADLDAQLRQARARARQGVRIAGKPPAVVADWDLQGRLLGTWWCRSAPRSQPEFGYRFGAGGRLEQLDADGEVEGAATWIVVDGVVRIRWAGGSEEVGKCRWIGNGLSYAIAAHDDAIQVGDAYEFARRSD